MSAEAFDRDANLERLADEWFDVLVVGAGITGVGVALDAASRGLRTALVEKDDFSSGTSSKSSKLVHGGLRYVQQGEIALVYENLHERQRLLANAPHLVRPLPFLVPVLTKDGIMDRRLARAFGSLLWTYDLTGAARIGKLHRRVSVDEAMSHVPTLRRERLASAYLYYDAAADDSRLTLAIARTAAVDYGCAVANRAAVVGLLKDPDGTVRGAQVDAGSGPFDVRARVVVNAAGVWADEIRALDEGSDPHSIRPAKGIHITVPWDKVRNDIAAIVPVPSDKRSIFIIPWGDFTYLGTTDTDYQGRLDDPPTTAEDVEYLLAAVNAATTADLNPSDVLGVWAGLRPLVKGEANAKTADLSRRHTVRRSDGGVVTVTGGKLTTYRKMAVDTVDVAVEALGYGGRSRTKRLRLRGADGYDTLRPADAGRLGVSDAVLDHLASRYGGEARALLGMISADRSLLEPLIPGLPYLRAEAVYGARYEMAQTLDDVLSRRTRARILDRAASVAAAGDVARLLAGELGWDDAEVERQVASYTAAATLEADEASLPGSPFDAAVGA